MHSNLNVQRRLKDLFFVGGDAAPAGVFDFDRLEIDSVLSVLYPSCTARSLA